MDTENKTISMKTLLLTGASGFLGTQILPKLQSVYDVRTLGRSTGNDIVCDLSSENPQLSEEYDIVVHAAGKAHVIPRSGEEAEAFYDINYQGTVRLCSALESVGVPGTFVFVSTIAVYGLIEGENVDESAPLIGTTPYAKSKIMAETYLQDWCRKYNVKLAILRTPLLCGPNPPGNLGSMIHGISSGRYLSVAGGKARKSVLMAEDISNLIPLLEGREGVYNVCDDNQPSFRDLEILISRQLGKSEPYSIPYWLAKGLACIGDMIGSKAPINSERLRKICSSLTFSNDKVKRKLGWKPMNVLESFVVK